jgi:hypothetical protein
MKTQLNSYLRKKKISPSKLATLAKVGAYSVTRYLRGGKTDNGYPVSISLATANKLKRYMARNP